MAHIDPQDPKSNPAPVPKVAAATAAGALATVVVIVVTSLTHTDAPPGLEGAVATILAFVAGYLAPPRGS